MIFCTDKIYGKVWKISSKSDKYMDIQMSTSEKKDGQYINSNWFPRVIGHALNSLKDTLSDGDRIVITKCKISMEPYTAKDGTKKSQLRFIILEAEKDDGNKKMVTLAPDKHAEEPSTSEDVCPW